MHAQTFFRGVGIDRLNRIEISPIRDLIESKILCMNKIFSIFCDLHNTSYNLTVNQYCLRHIFLPEHLFQILNPNMSKINLQGQFQPFGTFFP